MAAIDPKVLAHLEWLGFVQPTGLVVSAPALVRAGAILDRHDAEGQRRLRAVIDEAAASVGTEPEPQIADFQEFAQHVLGWSLSPKGYAGFDGSPIPEELRVPLPDYGETLVPDFAVRERDPVDSETPWELLGRVLDAGDDLDHVPHGAGKLEASAHGRMERLLRETGVPAGLLFNGRALRLISAPRGESSGWLEFRVADMAQTAGRPICAAMRLLLGEPRLLTLPRDKRLAALLHDSRKYQNEVSEKLAEQVLHALYELLRGFQAAHDTSGGELLREPLSHRPDDVYRALLTVILRLVFVLYAEERDMLPADETFLRYYALAGLYERLREDAALHPDTMDQRYGAWAQLLALFRMVHDGARGGDLRMPARRGVLFDPDRYPFLEGRAGAGSRQVHERIEPPLVPDGTIYRALEKLLVLDGERISYRALDVEQIGSVYETMMGFSLELASGRSVAVKAQNRYGAPSAVDLEALLAQEGGKRAKWLQDRSDRKLTTKLAAAVKDAAGLVDLHSVLTPVIDMAATPDLVPAGAMILQPSEERRRSGSHYTPRALTEPIVRTALEPILKRLRGDDSPTPHPADILELKICDPAMGSGAFLVEACRQLGDALRDAWNAHGERPDVPADEDDVLLARRMIAQRCLYGVDRNPVAVDLAKMSLWLVTLAREHSLTFVDHALRHGDSLVGLSRRQIESFHWNTSAPGLEAIRIGQQVAKVTELREQIREAGQDVSDWTLRDMWDEAQADLQQVRLFGDLVVVAFFSAAKAKDREAKRAEFALSVTAGQPESYRGLVDERRHADPPLVPFHWEIEFPEVFDRRRGGFDAIVGNPPFLGGRNLSATQGKVYSGWLVTVHAGASGGADLVAHFFRRAFDLLRSRGVFGLIATNTIAQGDTRVTGLRWICKHGGEIYAARRRVKWPGRAAVVVSVVHAVKGSFEGTRRLDGSDVEMITAFLARRGGDDDPVRLAENAGKSFVGVYVLGMGFTFDDSDTQGVATPIDTMDRLIRENARNAEVISPYIGGEQINTSPSHSHDRYVINFGERDEAACRHGWPELMAIVEEKVKPDRIAKDGEKYPRMVYEWWKFWNPRQELQAAIADLDRVLVIPRVSNAFGFTFLPAGMVYNEKTVVFPFESCPPFAVLQSRVHEVWARFFSSTLKDDLQYTPSDCFETFPLPSDWDSRTELGVAGKSYYEFRARLMLANSEGLTKTYNRFHDPYEHDPQIERLRELHSDVDRAVLAAYGWDDIPTGCDFILDYAIDEEEWGSKKKPYRYRWPDDVRDDVLARLIERNAERAAEEQRSGRAADGPGRATATKKQRAASAAAEGLF